MEEQGSVTEKDYPGIIYYPFVQISRKVHLILIVPLKDKKQEKREKNTRTKTPKLK